MGQPFATGRRVPMGASVDPGCLLPGRFNVRIACPATIRTRRSFHRKNRPRTLTRFDPVAPGLTSLRKDTNMSESTTPLRAPTDRPINRRNFLRSSAAIASGFAALAASLAPLRELKDFTSVDEFMRKYYKEM